MYIITTLDKDLYDQARVSGKIASIIAVAGLCAPKVSQQIQKNIFELEFIRSKFDLTKEHTDNTIDMENCLKIFNDLSRWLLPQISICPGIGFLREELCCLILLTEQRIILLREK